MRRDHKVEFRREEQIARIAAEWRRAGGVETRGAFKITTFFTEVVCKFARKANITIQFFDKPRSDGIPAYVAFSRPDFRGNRRITLRILRELWEHAALGDGLSRFIVAHEIGHIVLGHYHATAFSNDPSGQAAYVRDEERAEWQANTFAKHLLLPLTIARQFDSPDRIAEFCDVDIELARDRFTEAQRLPRDYDGNACPACGNFTVLTNGRCQTCIGVSAHARA